MFLAIFTRSLEHLVEGSTTLRFLVRGWLSRTLWFYRLRICCCGEPRGRQSLSILLLLCHSIAALKGSNNHDSDGLSLLTTENKLTSFSLQDKQPATCTYNVLTYMHYTTRLQYRRLTFLTSFTLVFCTPDIFDK